MPAIHSDTKQVQIELNKFGNECGTDLEGASMPGPKGYTHGWVHHGAPASATIPGRITPDRLKQLQHEAANTDPITDWPGGIRHLPELINLYHSGALFGSKPRGDYTVDDLLAQRRFVSDPHLNRALRAGKIPNTGETPEGIAKLDETIRRHRTQIPIQVFRGINPGVVQRLQPGDILTHSGYSSTSLDPRIAQKFGTVMSVSIPVGTQAAWFPVQRSDRPTDTEYEILLPRDSTIKISRIDPDGPTVFGELVPSDGIP